MKHIEIIGAQDGFIMQLVKAEDTISYYDRMIALWTMKWHD